MITTEGKQAFLQIMFQGNNILVPAGANYFVGLCQQNPVVSDTLASITSEPTSQGGYARIGITRDALGFPTIGEVNNETRILSVLKTFSAVGADFSTTFDRLFLTNVASGTSGTLFAYSGQYSSPVLLVNGTTQDFQFEFYP